MIGYVVGHVIGQTQFGYMTFPQSCAIEVLESQFMTLPLKELAITSDMANTIPHIIYCWNTLMKGHTRSTTYMGLLYMWFAVCIQYLCKCSFSIPFKEYAITSHIIHLMPHIICCWKALIKIILDAAYTALLHVRFLAHIQYLCKCGFWVPCKECLMMLDIFDIITHIICH